MNNINLFYKAIQCQKNLDRIYPDRYWPVGATEPPKPHVITITKMYASVSKAMVTRITRHSRFNQMPKHSCKI